MLAFYADDWALTDHRALGWEPVQGREGAGQFVRSAFANVPDLDFTVDEVFGCDDRVIACRCSWGGSGLRGSGPWTYSIGTVQWVRDGQLAGIDVFGPDDVDAMLARYAELTRQRPWHTFDQLFNARAMEVLPSDLHRGLRHVRPAQAGLGGRRRRRRDRQDRRRGDRARPGHDLALRGADRRRR